MPKTSAETTRPQTQFMEEIAVRPIDGVKTGTQAMQAAGSQPEFISANMLQAEALNSAIILRAGNPPVYNRPRGPKSGLNLSKTSNQGFFKGAIAADLQFTRKEGSKLRGHDAKDADHLKKSVKEDTYQHTVQLSVTTRDILREVGPGGDLKVLGYNSDTGQLRLAFKEGRHPENYKGQFVLDLKSGKDEPQFYSRPWDRPEQDPNWDPAKKIIHKPTELEAIPDEVYEQIFLQNFNLNYSDNQSTSPTPEELKPAKVLANTPRTPKEFIEAMGEDHPQYPLVKDLRDSRRPTDLQIVLDKLDETTIRETYDKSALIIAGDWDGLALGHPAGLKPEYAKVYNTFEKDTLKKMEQMTDLLQSCEDYFAELQTSALEKPEDQRNQFDKLVLSADDFESITSEFALSRAGCITPHEFLFQQLINHAYRDEANIHYGEKFDMPLLQSAMENVLSESTKEEKPTIETLHTLAHKALSNSSLKLNESNMNEVASHLARHSKVALDSGAERYQLPHPHYDQNVDDLYQHGFDMRNPYGSNLDGAWLTITADGGIIYGETEQQLIKMLLTGDFLEKNHIDINFAANMGAGWDKVIARQLELGQVIPKETQTTYDSYTATQKKETQQDVVAQKTMAFNNFKKDYSSIKTETPTSNKQANEEADVNTDRTGPS